MRGPSAASLTRRALALTAEGEAGPADPARWAERATDCADALGFAARRQAERVAVLGGGQAALDILSAANAAHIGLRDALATMREGAR